MQVLAQVRFSKSWMIVVGVAILVNAISLGVLTEVREAGPVLTIFEAIDQVTVALLIMDALLTIVVKRLGVFRSGWDMFDITVTAVSVVPFLQAFSALRAFRTVRLLRLLTFIPHGRATVDGLFAAMRSMTSTLIMVLVVFYIFIILCTMLFRDLDPAHFGTLGLSAESLYEVAVYYGADPEVMKGLTHEHPWTWFIFVPFIFLTSFALLNMFIGVLTAAIDSEMQKDASETNVELERIEGKLDALAARLEEVLGRLPGGSTVPGSMSGPVAQASPAPLQDR